MRITRLLVAGLAFAAASSAAAQSRGAAPTGAAASAAWNASDPAFNTNGNHAVALALVQDQLTLAGDDVRGDEVIREPGRFIGRIACFRGRIKAVQDYPPIDGRVLGQVVLVTPERTFVTFHLAGGTGDLQFEQPVRLCGYPVGRVTVPDRRGGTVEHLVVTGRQFKAP